MTAMGLLLACARPQSFVPTERLTALSPRGFAAAEYDLRTRRGHLGQVRIWSHGAQRVRFEGQRRALVHVGLLVQNESDVPLVLDEERIRLDSVAVNGDVFQNIPVARIEGERIIAPGRETRVDLYFAMIPGVYPTDMGGFRLRWALRDNGVIYAQRTPFLPRPVRRAPTYYYGRHYDPFWGPRFGPGWRWGPGYGPRWGPRRPRRW